MDLGKLGGPDDYVEPPLSVTNKGTANPMTGAKRRLSLQSPQAADVTKNTLAERAGAMKDKVGEDDTMKRELPEEEFRDFLNTYDETAW